MDPFLCEDDLDEEKGKRSILVSNIPDNVSRKDVIIHFQKQSNGGGEVVSGMYADKENRTCVIITFEEPSIVETAIGRPQNIKGAEVTVQWYPVDTRIPEIFSVVDARLNPDMFGPDSTFQSVLPLLEREYGIDCHQSKYGYVIRGSYQQITSCHKYILDEILNNKPKRLRQSRSAHSDKANMATAMTPDDRSVSPGSRGESEEEIDVKVFQAVPIILQFIFTVQKYRSRLKVIESEYAVRIRAAENGSKVGIFPSPRCTQPKSDDACEEYIKLYRDVTDGPMLSKDVVLRPGKDSSYLTAKEAVKEVLQEAPVVIQEMDEPDTWLFYGEDRMVRSAVKDVCGKLKIDNPFGKVRKVIARHVTENEEEVAGAHAPSSHRSSYDHKTDPDAQREKPNDTKNPIHNDVPHDNNGRFVIVTKKGFHLSVYQGDITCEPVDVIVSSSVEYLGFKTGLPAALVRRGGRVIQEEAEAESRKGRGRAKPGDIIMTGPGRLSCSKIIHILTKQYNSSKKSSEAECKMMIKESCFSCLKLAQIDKLKSIAFPAVGSGQQRTPLGICATAMVNAVEEYMKKSRPQKGAVADIRFVDTDPFAVEAFQTELTKRYGESITKSPAKNDTAGSQSKHKTLILPPVNSDDSSVDKKTASKDEEKDVCPICLDNFHDPTTLRKCNHMFCRLCIDKAFKHRKACPTCGMAYGVHTGNMPSGSMRHYMESYRSLPGYERFGTIRIEYSFGGGIQGPEHPNPGQRYYGTARTAYLPDCPEGREVLGLLKKSFDARLTFTIGTSVTTGMSNTVTWNDIHHKTSTYGGATGFGYPDPTYLKRVKEELAAKGIS